MVSPDVNTLWYRYMGYLEGHEPLLDMAYFCLTVVEQRPGGRSNAAKQYQIDAIVLRKLGELTSIRGDNRTARKLSSGPVQPLTTAEAAWILAAVRAFIVRMGEYAFDPDHRWPPITMDGLPSL